MQPLMEKIQTLPPHRLVQDFVDFIRIRERKPALTHDAATSSLPAFAAVGNNPEDDVTTRREFGAVCPGAVPIYKPSRLQEAWPKL